MRSIFTTHHKLVTMMTPRATADVHIYEKKHFSRPYNFSIFNDDLLCKFPGKKAIRGTKYRRINEGKCHFLDTDSY